jgi:hypothetical protein
MCMYVYVCVCLCMFVYVCVCMCHSYRAAHLVCATCSMAVSLGCCHTCRFETELAHPLLEVDATGLQLAIGKNTPVSNSLVYAVGNTLLAHGVHYFEIGEPGPRPPRPLVMCVVQFGACARN